MRSLHAISSVGLLAGFAVGAGCWERAYGHCAALNGDQTCIERGMGSYCDLCQPERDGCTEHQPEENCHFAGSALDVSGVTMSGASTSDGSTGTISSVSTNAEDLTTDATGSGGTTDQGCTSHGECQARDEALPFCGEDGICVSSCDDAADGNAACKSVDEAMPVCVEGSCVQCTDQEASACGNLLLGCHDELHVCNCTEHEHCGDAGCNFYTGTCLPPNKVVHVGSGHAFDSIGAAVVSFGPREEGTILLHGGPFVNSVSIGGGRLLAILAADGESPIWNHLGDYPQLSVDDSTIIIDGLELSGHDDSRYALEVGGDLTKVWVDRSRIVNNAGGSVLVEGGAQLTLRNCFVGGNETGVPAVEIDAAVATVAYSTLIAGGGSNGRALRCTVGSIVQVDDSVLLKFGIESNPIKCSAATINHSASEQDLSSMGTNNVVVSSFGGLTGKGLDWFLDARNGDFALTGWGATVFAGIAEWNIGDPLTDIEGNPRDKNDGDPDHAGADQP